MRLGRNQKSSPIDIEHMRTLHEECIEQLELIEVSLEAAQLANYLIRDNLDLIAVSHWHSYIDIIHLVCMHDDALMLSMKKAGLDVTSDDAITEQQYEAKRLLLIGLLRTLIRHHQRMIYLYRVSGEPTKDFLIDAEPLEREHIANIIGMIHRTI